MDRLPTRSGSSRDFRSFPRSTRCPRRAPCFGMRVRRRRVRCRGDRCRSARPPGRRSGHRWRAPVVEDLRHRTLRHERQSRTARFDPGDSGHRCASGRTACRSPLRQGRNCGRCRQRARHCLRPLGTPAREPRHLADRRRRSNDDRGALGPRGPAHAHHGRCGRPDRRPPDRARSIDGRPPAVRHDGRGQRRRRSAGDDDRAPSAGRPQSRGRAGHPDHAEGDGDTGRGESEDRR